VPNALDAVKETRLFDPVYQPTDAPRYFKANKGLLVICVWMCVSTPPQQSTIAKTRWRLILHQLIQYPGTYFYYRWRNNQKASKWSAFTEEEKDEYSTTSSDEGNKR